jgi:exodeoxyribonuclease VII large subunit
LSAFNSERVARAIVSSHLPVVSAVGHETDFTITDFVADLRAPTPSAAAELITQAQHRVVEHVDLLASRVERAGRFQLLHARQSLDSIPLDRAARRLNAMLFRASQRLDDFGLRMETHLHDLIRARRRDVADLAADVLHHEPRQILSRAKERIAVGSTRMERSLERTLRRWASRVDALDARLGSLSPLAVLERGYALVKDTDGLVIRSVAQVAAGQHITIRLHDGEFRSAVEEVSALKQRKK